jgi:hypothetical protein
MNMSGQLHDPAAFLSKEEDWLQLDTWLSEALRQILCSGKAASSCPSKKLNLDSSVFQSLVFSLLSKIGIIINHVGLSVQNLIPFIQDVVKVTWHSMISVLRLILCGFWANLYKSFMDQVTKYEQCITHFFYIFQINFLLMNHLEKTHRYFSAFLRTRFHFQLVINILNLLMSC